MLDKARRNKYKIMAATTIQSINLGLSIFSFLGMCCGFVVAWGRMQQWKEDTNEKILNIEKAISILHDIDHCMEEFDKLNLKLYMKDGTPSYITRGVCIKNMEHINEIFSTHKEHMNEKFNSLKVCVDNVSNFKPDLESMHKILGSMLEQMEKKNN